MDHADHVRLLRKGVEARQDVIASGVSGAPDVIDLWADLGAGSGAFTRALADLLPPDSTIHAVDKDNGALAENERAYARFARGRDVPRLETHAGDFTSDLGLPPLDGIVMANSLHFVRDKGPVLARVRALLKPGAPLILVEYDADNGNPWVPYPLSFDSWKRVAVASGFAEPRFLDAEPSRFLRRIYSAVTTPRER
jgi:SAM-dependent methyltransferase